MNAPANTLGTFARPTPAKKISAKSIIGNVKAAIKAAGGTPAKYDDEGVMTEDAPFVELFRVTGQVTGVKTGNSTFGEWVAYVGDIMAVDMVTSEVFKGRELFLPSEADIVLRDPLTEATKGGGVVDVAVAIEAKLARTAVGYMYRARPLMALDQPESRASQLLLQFGGDKVKALAAPAAAATATEAAPAAATPAAAAPAKTAKK